MTPTWEEKGDETGMALSSRKRFGQNGLQLTEYVYYLTL